MRSHYVLIALWLFSAFAAAQEAHFQVPINNGDTQFNVDLTSVSSMAGASITIRNNATTDVSMPWISAVGTMPPLSAQAIVASITPSVANDEQFAVAAWQYVSNRTFGYCSAGSRGDGSGLSKNPMRIFYGYGFGCCEQQAEILGWLWSTAGYQARIAVMSFHTVPEIYYGNAWHMLDPNHHVIYRNQDGSIASVAQVLADPTIVANTADANGLDPIGWQASKMASLYAANASTLQYQNIKIDTPAPAEIVLHPRASVQLINDNPSPTTFFVQYGTDPPVGPHQVESAVLRWPVRYSDAYWKQLVTSFTGVSATTASDGRAALVVSTGGTGSVIYKISSPFPTSQLTVQGEFFAQSASSMTAAFSANGSSWSTAVPFQSLSKTGIFTGTADLSQYAAGAYSYFIRVTFSNSTAGNVGLYGLLFRSNVQMATSAFPALSPDAINSLEYRDTSPAQQFRNLTIDVSVPADVDAGTLAARVATGVSPATPADIRLRGLTAESMVAESAKYSVARNDLSQNLVDGDSSTLAYPGSANIDYIVHLNGAYHVSQVSIWWGYFGSSPYVSTWTLLGRSSATQPWQVLQNGVTPNTALSDVPISADVTDLRISASSNNWIGLYEMEVYGHESFLPFSDISRTVTSNVAENLVYSGEKGYSAANLIDGNGATLAYPGSHNVDYQVSLGANSHVTGANVIWGYFGSRPEYVSSWSILGLNSSGTWDTLAGGGTPGATSTAASFDTYASALRLVANSVPNWIGAYELSIAVAKPIEPISVVSNVAELAAYAHPASNLIDGNEDTLAYPARAFFDYQLDFGSNTYLDQVTLVWGRYGTNPIYISSWALYGQRDGDSAWVPIARGDCPNAVSTLVGIGHTYRQLRISGNSTANWIGLYEVEAYGVNFSSTSIIKQTNSK